jgi:RNA polymerase sigma factor (TIGR02999 family)
MGEATQLLLAIERGDAQAADQLLPLVYDQLRQLAARRLAEERPGQTLQPTALVHEAYLRLVGPLPTSSPGPGREAQACWNSRGHFYAAAAEAMRRILVETARRKLRLRHGGGRRRQDVNALDLTSPQMPDELLAISEALDRLAATNAQAAELVKLRFFAGLSNEEAAAALGVSPRKANQIWAYARAWLLESIGHEPT